MAPSQPGRRHLYLYWRVGRGDQAAARSAALRLQQHWLRECPGLAASLLVRSDADGDEITFMETYSVDAAIDGEGVGGSLQQRIASEGGTALGPWLRGPRHLEVFEAVAI